MKKILLTLTLWMGVSLFAGEILLPEERVAMPVVTGDHIVCIWDESAKMWYTDFQSYDHSGSVIFQVPEWGRWYWIGLWDVQAEQYVFGKWVGHFPSV